MSTASIRLRFKMDQRISRMKDRTEGLVPGLDLPTVVVAMLTDPPPEATEKQLFEWERMCDLCDSPGHELMHSGHLEEYLEGRTYTITFSVCPSCFKELRSG